MNSLTHLNQMIKGIYYVFVTLLGSVLIAASAQIEVPLWPVPVTLQSFAVLFLAMSLGWRLGLAMTLTYLAEGAVGLPVFFGFSGGIAHLLGPTGGYLFAYPIAAVLAGWLTQSWAMKSLLKVFAVAVVSLSLVLVIGMVYLSLFVGFPKAYWLGVFPFFLGEGLKAVMLVVMIPHLRSLRRA
jgi:biotin transport system substrate-specific component